MPPKQSTSTARGRGASSAAGRPPKAKPASTSKRQHAASSSSRGGRQTLQSPQIINSDQSDLDPFADDDDDDPPRRERQRQEQAMEVDQDEEEDNNNGEEDQEDKDDDDDEAQKTIPPELLTRLLHEFFEKDGTRISRDANAAVAKYMDIFVREAVARTAVEKGAGFLEVEDLEKVAPQLLLDL
ncbi:Uu.00g074110.m01.CDS01 [Anthostomella pinea]|uniref:Uu.00g074110.m01.CDS01 n=1 Tax=Anthostomella pinea TaxID=933095 RepID=A0AAI8VPS7_9PEZI|nr:Uu.00g074110.m01.CDS01 [Anthostomella pinea]